MAKKTPDVVAASPVTITDDNFRQFVTPHQDALGKRSKGLVPRLFSTHPQGYLGAVAEPFGLPLIPESEWDDRISEQEKNKSSLQHVRDQMNFGGRAPSYDQNGKGYCWAHSTTSAVTLVRGFNNQPYVPLSAYHVACIIKGYRDQGGWGAESLEFVAKRGIASAQFWPMQSMSRSNDTPAMWENAALHKVSEWWDLSENRSQAKQQLATLLLMNVPVVVDYNWWGHSVCAVRLVKRSPFTVRIWNSWGDSWSDAGMGDLVDNKAIPDGAVAPRVMSASVV